MSEKKSFPEHVAIILDGNGRWAQKRGRREPMDIRLALPM